MRFRKLRIAWSVLCGLAAVLLIVLWFWSYWWWGRLTAPPINTIANAVYGSLTADFGEDWTKTENWYFQKKSVDRLVKRGFLIPDYSHLYRFELKRHWVCVPLWTLVLIPIAAGVAPWLRFRFPLRTLLIATTLVAVVFGLVVYAGRR